MYCALSWAEELAVPADVDEAVERHAATSRFWRAWLGRARIPDHRWRDPIQRSALAIKGLTYMPTGATVAALTTSLPETPGGERNWDYRYTWMRDTTFTLQALHWLNLDWEADEFMQFVADIEPTEDGSLQIMYGIDGRRDLTETTRDDLTGYAGARPVRIGNGAFDQRQNDVFGAVLDSILLHTRRGERLPRRLWPIVESQAECASKVWQQPDQGIWEARGKPQHYVSSKLMCWVALDRAAKLAEIRGDGDLKQKWGAVADEIRDDILEHGVSDKGVLKQHYETDSLDASVLLAAIFEFLPAGDERLHATVSAIAEDLTENGFVLRYRTDETDDGLSGKEGTFLICSFWLVSALAIVGELQRARDLMEKLLRDRVAARPLRGGVRRRHRPASRQLPPGVLAPCPDGSRGENHRPRDAGAVLRWITTTSSSSGPEPAAARSPVISPLRGSASCCSSAATGCPASRRTGSRRTSSSRTAMCRRRRGTTAAGGRSSPRSTTSSAARRSSTGPRSIASARRTSASCNITTGSRLRGRSPTTSSSRTTRRPSSSTRCTAPAARIPPSRPPARRIRIRRSRTSLVSSNSRMRSRRRAITRSTRRAGSCSTENNMPYSACVRCANCDGFPCVVHAKSDAEVIGVRPALEHANVTLLTNTKVVKLETDDAGTTVSNVVAERDGSTETFTADIVVVACGAANTAHLLLASASDKHPSGLANASDQVGRNFMFHDSVAVLALSREENPTVYQKTLGLNDFYFGSDDFEFPMGNIQMVGKSQAEMFRGEKPGETRFAPEWSLERVAKHAIDFWLSTEDLPRPDNRVTVDRDGKVTVSYTETNAEAKRRLYEKLRSMLGPLDLNAGHLIHRFAYMKTAIPVAGCAHQAGTARFGLDPESSVLNENCRAHDVDNLYVVDTSVFPSIGAVNPALTAMANSMRVGDHLLERLGSGG